VFLIGNPLLYLSHFIPYVLFNSYVLLYLLYTQRLRRAAKIVAYNMPLLIVFIHYFLTKKIPDIVAIKGGYSLWNALSSKIATVILFFMPIPLMSGIHDGCWYKGAFYYCNFLFALAYGVVFLLYLCRIKSLKNRFHFGFVCLLFSIYMVLPTHMSGMYKPGERVLLLLSVLILAELLTIQKYKEIFLKLFTLIFVFQFGYICWLTYDYNNNYAMVTTEKEARRGEHNVFQRKRFYLAIQQNCTDLDFFTTGILRR
jgi:hypothetical protein